MVEQVLDLYDETTGYEDYCAMEDMGFQGQGGPDRIRPLRHLRAHARLVDEHPTAIGKAIPGEEIMVLDKNNIPIEPGEIGELVHRGILVAQGYWNDPETTAIRLKKTAPPFRQPFVSRLGFWARLLSFPKLLNLMRKIVGHGQQKT